MGERAKAIYQRFVKQVRAALKSPHVWVVAAMFVVGIIFHYPQQILRTESPSLLSFIGLNSHTVERILFLIPIAYTGMFLGRRAGIASLFLAMVIILPRVFFLSSNRPEAFLETGAVLVLGILVNLWFEAKRRENTIYRRLANRLEESEGSLQASERKYRYLFENASDAIWIQDVNGLFVDANRAFEKMTGFTVAELKGVQLAKFLSSESLALAREVRDKLVRAEPFEQPYEQQFSIKDGSIKTVKMSTNPIMAGGRISGFEHVARDVTREKRQQENVRSYIQQITRVQEEERKRIARDLHDEVSPEILILIQKLDKLAVVKGLKLADVRKNIAGLRRQAVDALQSLRRCAQGLRPRIIDDLGLEAALGWLADELEKELGIEVRVEVAGIDRALSPETQIVLFRIAQEAANNIRKHAAATKVAFKVLTEDSAIIMTVTDNGRGFEVPPRAEGMVSAGRLGLMGMYERTRLLNGSLEIKSGPGKGTEVTVRLPRVG
jgi:PAS domain S-box-containing protein